MVALKTLFLLVRTSKSLSQTVLKGLVTNDPSKQGAALASAVPAPAPLNGEKGINLAARNEDAPLAANAAPGNTAPLERRRPGRMQMHYSATGRIMFLLGMVSHPLNFYAILTSQIVVNNHTTKNITIMRLGRYLDAYVMTDVYYPFLLTATQQCPHRHSGNLSRSRRTCPS